MIVLLEEPEAWSLMMLVSAVCIDNAGISDEGKEAIRRWRSDRNESSPEMAALTQAVALTERTAAVVMSHHFARDAEYVKALITAGVAYVGVLGPRPRTERMLAELAARGEEIPSGAATLFGPVGLDIGGDGPEAIALAIVSEVSAVLHGRTAAHLRDARAALHESVSR